MLYRYFEKREDQQTLFWSFNMYKLTAYIEKGIKGKEAERKYVQHFDDRQEAEQQMNKRLISKLEEGFEEVRPEFYGYALNMHNYIPTKHFHYHTNEEQYFGFSVDKQWISLHSGRMGTMGFYKKISFETDNIDYLMKERGRFLEEHVAGDFNSITGQEIADLIPLFYESEEEKRYNKDWPGDVSPHGFFADYNRPEGFMAGYQMELGRELYLEIDKGAFSRAPNGFYLRGMNWSSLSERGVCLIKQTIVCLWKEHFSIMLTPDQYRIVLGKHGAFQLGHYKNPQTERSYHVCRWKDCDDSSYTLYFSDSDTLPSLELIQFDN